MLCKSTAVNAKELDCHARAFAPSSSVDGQFSGLVDGFKSLLDVACSHFLSLAFSSRITLGSSGFEVDVPLTIPTDTSQDQLWYPKHENSADGEDRIHREDREISCTYR
jgi:hypothetical protein